MSKTEKQQHKGIKHFWSGIFVLTVVLLAWVNQTVRTTQLSYAIQNVEQELKKEQRKKMELEMLKDRYLALESVEDIAKSKLGLVIPRDENIVMVSLNEDNMYEGE